VRVHAGFWNAYQSVRDEMMDEINLQYFQMRRLTSLQSPSPAQYDTGSLCVICTGHSLGGALATFAALDIQRRHKEQLCEVSCITFGSPRLGNRRWAKLFRNHVPRTLRFVFDRDLVTSQPHGFSFQHVGHEAIIDSKGNCITNPSFVEQTFFEARVNMKDHAMVSYEDGMESVARTLHREARGT